MSTPMQKTLYVFEVYAPTVLRLGMSTVILWFSIQQFMHTDMWTAFVPASVVAFTHINAFTLVIFNAIFELIFGTLLAFGWQTRIVALLLALHLFDIMWTVGYGGIGVRDFGLAIATMVIAMNGPDLFCVQQRSVPSQRSVDASVIND